jgi:GNAT superfamily N-acetyltransferase
MSVITVRPFRRGDRDQLTDLVNAHAQAVVPGVTASVNAVLGQLEREPGEFITGPWVWERLTLVAEQRHRVAAAARLLRYFPDERAGPRYRDLGEIGWFLFWPEASAANPCWPDSTAAARALMQACLHQFGRWGVSRLGAGGELPVRGVYGVPEQWPHIRDLYGQAGFTHTGHTEIVYLARVPDLRRPAITPVPGLTLRRSVGMNGTRLTADLDEAEIGWVEVELVCEAERMPRRGGWADVGNLGVSERYRRRGVATWLLGRAAEWLELAHVDRLLDYASAGQDPSGTDDAGTRAFLQAVGFLELTRTRRGWTREPVKTPT